MASILDRYGIKEVADVTFYKINKETGEADIPVLYLDTLKVSTIEQTAETTDARGGKGNPKLVTWDYGKDITVTLEDALFSAKSLSIMFGNGDVNYTEATSGATVTRTVMAKVQPDGAAPAFFTADIYDENQGAIRKKVYFTQTNEVEKYVGALETDVITPEAYAELGDEDKAKYTAVYKTLTTAPNGGVLYSESGLTITKITGEDGTEGSFDEKVTLPATAEANDRIFITYTVKVNKKEIVISADTFPGTYYVTGDTYARSDVDGSDQFFQFIIPKAKVTSENTITLEAEGDPSVFNMNLSVLRPEDGEMMKLVQYDLAE